MVKKWQKLVSTALADYRIFTARQDTSLSPRTNKKHNFYVLESPDWINVIPITPDQQVIMIYQYRHGIEAITLEIPGGMCDPTDKSPAMAGAREVREETGYTVKQMIHIGSVTPNPAFLDNKCHTYLALGAKKVGEPSLDGAEDIAVKTFPLTAVPNLISSGQITHALVIAAFYHFEQYQKQYPNWYTLNKQGDYDDQ